MTARLTYGVFLPGGKWGRTNSLKIAKEAIDSHGGGTIRSIPSAGNDTAYDSHTFHAVSDLVPYTPKKPKIKLTKTTKKRTTRKGFEQLGYSLGKSAQAVGESVGKSLGSKRTGKKKR